MVFWVQQGSSIFLCIALLPMKPTMVENKGDISGVGQLVIVPAKNNKHSKCGFPLNVKK